MISTLVSSNLIAHLNIYRNEPEMSLSVGTNHIHDRFVPAVWVALVMALVIFSTPLRIIIAMGVITVAAYEASALVFEAANRTRHFSEPFGGEPKMWIRVATGAYVSGFAMALIFLGGRDKALLGFTLVMIALADVAAYYGGKALGRHKVAVRISEGKSWEGIFCGVAVAEVVALAFWLSGWSGAHGTMIFLWSAVITIISIAGDFLESWFKRQAGVKDSGKLLREHGGVLDRIDAQLLGNYAAVVLVLAGLLG